MVAQWEWMILLLLFLGLLVVELVRTRRAIRRAGDAPRGSKPRRSKPGGTQPPLSAPAPRDAER